MTVESSSGRSKPSGTARLQRNLRLETGTAGEAVRKVLPKNLPKTRKKRERGKDVSAEMFEHLQGEDRILAEAVQTALDNDDFEGTVAAATKALTSKNSEVRLNAVEALGWFGVEALPELTACMADEDEDVQQAAESQWEQAVQDVEDPSARFKIVAAVFSKLSNEDQLQTLGGLLDCAATEWIDSAENTGEEADRRQVVIQELVNVIESGSAKNAAAARETYESVTGNEWKSIEEAERYLADPENYDPDAELDSCATDDEPVGEDAAETIN